MYTELPPSLQETTTDPDIDLKCLNSINRRMILSDEQRSLLDRMSADDFFAVVQSLNFKASKDFGAGIASKLLSISIEKGSVGAVKYLVPRFSPVTPENLRSAAFFGYVGIFALLFKRLKEDEVCTGFFYDDFFSKHAGDKRIELRNVCLCRQQLPFASLNSESEIKQTFLIFLLCFALKGKHIDFVRKILASWFLAPVTEADLFYAVFDSLAPEEMLDFAIFMMDHGVYLDVLSQNLSKSYVEPPIKKIVKEADLDTASYLFSHGLFSHPQCKWVVIKRSIELCVDSPERKKQLEMLVELRAAWSEEVAAMVHYLKQLKDLNIPFEAPITKKGEGESDEVGLTKALNDRRVRRLRPDDSCEVVMPIGRHILRFLEQPLDILVKSRSVSRFGDFTDITSDVFINSFSVMIKFYFEMHDVLFSEVGYVYEHKNQNLMFHLFETSPQFFCFIVFNYYRFEPEAFAELFLEPICWGGEVEEEYFSFDSMVCLACSIANSGEYLDNVKYVFDHSGFFPEQLETFLDFLGEFRKFFDEFIFKSEVKNTSELYDSFFEFGVLIRREPHKERLFFTLMERFFDRACEFFPSKNRHFCLEYVRNKLKPVESSSALDGKNPGGFFAPPADTKTDADIVAIPSAGAGGPRPGSRE